MYSVFQKRSPKNPKITNFLNSDKKTPQKQKPETQVVSFNILLNLQLTLVISTSLILNNRLSRSENLVPA